MNWINSEETPVPKDLNVYLGLFEGQFCLISWWEEDNCFWMNWLPGQYSSDTKIKKEEEIKISHWCLINKPIDY